MSLLRPIRLDGCWDSPDTDLGRCVPSQHDYSYSMGIGDAWSVMRPDYWNASACTTDADRAVCMARSVGASSYHYGLETPHYPVPALADTAMVLTLGAWERDPNHALKHAWDNIWRDNIPDYVPLVLR